MSAGPRRMATRWSRDSFRAAVSPTPRPRRRRRSRPAIRGDPRPPGRDRPGGDLEARRTRPTDCRLVDRAPLDGDAATHPRSTAIATVAGREVDRVEPAQPRRPEPAAPRAARAGRTTRSTAFAAASRHVPPRATAATASMPGSPLSSTSRKAVAASAASTSARVGMPRSASCAAVRRSTRSGPALDARQRLVVEQHRDAVARSRGRRTRGRRSPGRRARPPSRRASSRARARQSPRWASRSVGRSLSRSRPGPTSPKWSDGYSVGSLDRRPVEREPARTRPRSRRGRQM